MYGRAQQQTARHTLALRPTHQQVAAFVLYHTGDFADHRAGRDLHARGDVIALEQHGCQCVHFLSGGLQHAIQQVFIRHQHLLQALVGRWIGNVEQVQRCLLRLAQECSALCRVAGRSGQVGGYQYVVQRAHVGLLMQCCAQGSMALAGFDPFLACRHRLANQAWRLDLGQRSGGGEAGA
ncbi:hypothetical protein D3C79_795270 [compost metagenome]